MFHQHHHRSLRFIPITATQLYLPVISITPKDCRHKARLKVVKRLISASAKGTSPESSGLSPLPAGANQGDAEIAAYLTSVGAIAPALLLNIVRPSPPDPFPLQTRARTCLLAVASAYAIVHLLSPQAQHTPAPALRLALAFILPSLERNHRPHLHLQGSCPSGPGSK